MNAVPNTRFEDWEAEQMQDPEFRAAAERLSNAREALAALVHQQWSGWMHYLFNLSDLNEDRSVTIPASLVARWHRQANTEYNDLPENEKKSDRHEADRIIAALEEIE